MNVVLHKQSINILGDNMKIWNVKEYGVLSYTKVLQTERIQRVIDMCHQEGGGEIIIPEGIYYIGSLRLYSHITLHLLKNAQLIGSQNKEDYTDLCVPTTLAYVNDSHYKEIWNLPSYYIYGILCAFNEHDISIIGEEGASINGQDCFDKNGEERFRGPMGIIFSSCQNIQLKGYTFINSANWSHQLDNCKHVDIQDVHIVAGHDGFNLHHCRGVHIFSCRIETGDDCLAGYDIHDLEVSSCYMNTACNVLRIGGKNIVIKDCQIEGPGHYPHLSEKTYETHCFFKYYSMNADNVECDSDILIQDCTIVNIPRLLSYDYGKKEFMQDNKPLRKLLFQNVKIDTLSKISCFKGNGEKCDLIFSQCSFQNKDIYTYLEIDRDINLVID